MKSIKYILIRLICLSVIIFSFASCERSPSDETVFATYPTTGEIFTDVPIGLGSSFYFPYAGSKLTAFSVDEDESYEGAASMRIDVPNASDPEGNYAGAIFRIEGSARNLTGYDALTFWAKSSQAATIAEIGFGEDFEENKFVTTLQNLQLTTNWVKYTVPIPDPSFLHEESGMLRYATGGIGEEGTEVGFTFWLDDIKFEKLGTIAQPRPAILNGEEVTVETFAGSVFTLTGLTQTLNLENGINQTVAAAPSYFTFKSSNPAVATVDELGVVNIVGTGTSVITATLVGVTASGSFTVNSSGGFVAAPVPTVAADRVISVFSNAYDDVNVDYFNGFWGGSTTQTSDISVNGDDIKSYTELNYVGIEFQNPTINASTMTKLHLDIYTDEDINGAFVIKIRDRGADGTIESDINGNPIGDDKEIAHSISNGGLKKGEWNSVEITLNGGLENQKNNLSQIVFVGGISSFLVDNIYFYN